jgi:hypothetical protein
MHPTAVRKRRDALQRARGLLVESAAILETARAFKLAATVRGNAEVAKWEIQNLIEQHGPIKEEKK